MSQQKKIAVIIPYFGNWPEWTDYFLHSCIANPTINWIIPTDCKLPDLKSDNLKFVPFTLHDFNVTVSEKLGLEINMEHPYKICDLKPAYGEIFSELLDGYDFWGYGDLDLVYGNIRKFFPDEILEEYDILSNHEDFVPGHFCLLRNSSKINELYKTGNHYIDSFSDKYYTGFDEQLKKNKINPDPVDLKNEQDLDRQRHLSGSLLRKRIKRLFPFQSGVKRVIRDQIEKKGNNSLNNPNSTKNIIEGKDFSSIVKKAANEELIKVSYSKRFESDLMLIKLGNKNWEVKWTDGSLKRKDGMDLLYFHFILSKHLEPFKVMKYKPGLKKFRINPGGINY